MSKLELINGIPRMAAETGGGSAGVTGSIQLSDGSGGFKDDGTNLFWDDSNNRLGIGTNSPGVTLNVIGATTIDTSDFQVRSSSFTGRMISAVQNDNAGSGAHARFKAKTANNGGDPHLLFENAGLFWNIGTDATDGKLKIGSDLAVGTNTRMTFLTNGDIGVGTDSPTENFHIKKPGNNVVMELESGAASSGGVIKMRGDQQVGDGFVAVIQAFNLTDQIAQIRMERDGANNSGHIQFRTSNVGSLTERMRIAPDGKVGIGTPSPSDDLHVAGDIRGEGGLRLNRTAVADADYTILTSDYYIGMSSLTATRTITLPVAATAGDGKIYVIKDESGNASGSVKITIDGDGAETIDGATTHDIDLAFDSITLICSGTAWFIVG